MSHEDVGTGPTESPSGGQSFFAPKPAKTAPSIDDFSEVCRHAATYEATELIHTVGPVDLTTCELIGLIAILRPAHERLKSSQHRAEVLKLMPKAVQG